MTQLFISGKTNDTTNNTTTTKREPAPLWLNVSIPVTIGDETFNVPVKGIPLYPSDLIKEIKTTSARTTKMNALVLKELSKVLEDLPAGESIELDKLVCTVVRVAEKEELSDLEIEESVEKIIKNLF